MEDSNRHPFSNHHFSLATKAVFLVLATVGLDTLWMGVAADMGSTLPLLNISVLVVGRPGPEP